MQNRFLQLGANLVGHDFVVGDIHGRYDQLMFGLDNVKFDFNKDRLFTVGDLIDRGNQNMEVLDLIGNPWFYTVNGNHEIMMAEAFTNRNTWHMWITNGGAWNLYLDHDDEWLLEKHFKNVVLDMLPYGLEFIANNGKKVGITHAGIPKQWPWWEVRKHLENFIPNTTDHIVNTLLWTRDKVQDTKYNKEVYGIDLLVHGHTPSKEIVKRGNAFFIDLGEPNNNKMQPINVMDLFDMME